MSYAQRAGAVAAAVALAYLAFGVFTAPANQHRVELELIDEATTWPWHSSLQRASAVWINSEEGQEWAGDARVRALEPRNIVELVILASGPSAEEAADAAEDTAAAFITHDEGLRNQPVEQRLDALTAELATLREEFNEQEIAVGQASDDAQIAARSTRLEATAALIGALEGQRSEAEEELAAQLTRYEVVESAPLDPVSTRLPETLKLFAGLGFLLLMAQLLLDRRERLSGTADSGEDHQLTQPTAGS